MFKLDRGGGEGTMYKLEGHDGGWDEHVDGNSVRSIRSFGGEGDVGAYVSDWGARMRAEE